MKENSNSIVRDVLYLYIEFEKKKYEEGWGHLNIKKEIVLDVLWDC